MKKIWVHKATSMQEANEFDLRYHLAMSRRERLETIQFLRETYRKYAQGRRFNGQRRKGLRRVITVIQ